MITRRDLFKGLGGALAALVGVKLAPKEAWRDQIYYVGSKLPVTLDELKEMSEPGGIQLLRPGDFDEDEYRQEYYCEFDFAVTNTPFGTVTLIPPRFKR
jgi:hypothetical protein